MVLLHTGMFVQFATFSFFFPSAPLLRVGWQKKERGCSPGAAIPAPFRPQHVAPSQCCKFKQQNQTFVCCEGHFGLRPLAMRHDQLLFLVFFVNSNHLPIQLLGTHRLLCCTTAAVVVSVVSRHHSRVDRRQLVLAGTNTHTNINTRRREKRRRFDI